MPTGNVTSISKSLDIANFNFSETNCFEYKMFHKVVQY